MKGARKRLQQRQVAASMVSTMDLYEQALTALTNAVGDGRSYGRQQQELISRLQPNQVAAIRCSDRDHYFRTVMIKANPLTNGFRALVSMPTYGEIPDGMLEMKPEIFLKQMRDMNAGLTMTDLLAFPFTGVGEEYQ